MVGIGNREELTPEKEADLYLERRRAKAGEGVVDFISMDGP
jgi:hypothetical protein